VRVLPADSASAVGVWVTTEQGDFVLRGLESRQYKVGAYTGDSDRWEEASVTWFPGTRSWDEAERITIEGEEEEVLEWTLLPENE
jgi:hypothetical protein